MEEHWTDQVFATNVEFRILKYGFKYDRHWQSVTIIFSIRKRDQQSIMTVSFKCGKRIDIFIGNEMDSYQVQSNFGTVNITSAKKSSTFCIRKVSKKTSLDIQKFLCNVSKRKQLPSDEKETSSLRSHSKPIKTYSTKRHSFSNHKVTQKKAILSSEERKFASLCTEQIPKIWSEQEMPENKRALNNNRKIKDFRQAQADVRHSNYVNDAHLEERKENTSPVTMDRLKEGLSTNSFYAMQNKQTTVDAGMSDFSPMPHITPSPKERLSITFKTSQTCNTPARRSLLLGDSTDKSFPKDSSISFADSEEVGHGFIGSIRPSNDTGNILSSRENRGFQNIGNTCYLNSTLQSLFGLLPFQKDVQNFGKTFTNLLHPNGVFSPILNLINHKSASSEEQIVLLRQIKEAITANNKAFHGYKQQDAHEFLLSCFEVLQKEVNEIIQKCESNVFQQEVTCPVKENFFFTVKRQFKCNKCGVVSSTEEELYDLPVELQSETNTNCNNAMQDLINRFFAAEDVEYSCETCPHHKATVRKSITRHPRILMISLKRYTFNLATECSLRLGQNVSLSRYITINHLCEEEQDLVYAERLASLHPIPSVILKLVLSVNRASGTNDYLHQPVKATNCSLSGVVSSCNDVENDRKLNRASPKEINVSLDADQLDLMSESEQMEYALQLSVEENATYGTKSASSRENHPVSSVESIFDEYVSHDDEHLNSMGNLPNSYRLVSIVSHHGGSSESGHYVSDVLMDSKNNEWKCFDDDRVFSVSESAVFRERKSTSYLLFFVHNDYQPEE